jgi:hypothetical protein
MAEASLKLGGSWATKEGSLLGFNDQNGNYKPIPFDFTRATTATRVNRNGLIEEVQSGVPRIDFTGDGSLLLEPQRTNSLPYSEDFSNAAWAKTNSTITINSAESPKGVDNAAAFIENTSLGEHRIQDGISLTSGIDYTFSVFVKANGRNFIRLRLENSGVGSGQINTWFDISNGTVGTSTAGTNSIVDMGNGWYRCISTGTTNTTSYLAKINVCDADNNVSYTGDGSKGVYIYGAQLEAGSYATSYIPTEGSAVTRNSDTSDGGESNNFDSSTAVWFIDLERTGIESGRAIYLADSSSVEQIRLHFDAPAEQIRFRDGKASFANIGGLISMGTSTRKKLALKIDGATLKVFVDGSQIGSDYTRPTAFTIEKLIIADDAFKLYDMKFYQSALTDTELQELTTL